MLLTATFLLTFLIGPAVFWVIARQRASKLHFVQLCSFAVALIVLAVLVPRIGWTDWQYDGLMVLWLLWLAWIVVLSLCVQAVRNRIANGSTHRWAFTMGAIATTLPWFGLHIAQMVAE